MMKKIIAKDLGSELMLYDPELDEVHALNASASLVYTLCKEGWKPEEIEGAMRLKFAVKEGEGSLEGIKECIAELREKGLLASSK